jgi:hypothetical protein
MDDDVSRISRSFYFGLSRLFSETHSMLSSENKLAFAGFKVSFGDPAPEGMFKKIASILRIRVCISYHAQIDE